METKAVNYTQEQTQTLVNSYLAGHTVEELAELLGRSTRSIVAKLSREGVYQSKAKPTGTQRVTKLDLVKAVARKLDLDWEQLKTLEQVDKTTLTVLAVAVAGQTDPKLPQL